MFDYIEENLQKIKNPNDVNVIYITKDKLKMYPVAILKGDENIRLAKPKMWLAPFSPMGYLHNTLGCFYWKDFAMIGESMEINRRNLVKMAYIEGDNAVDIYAWFDKGGSLCLASPSKKYFFSKLKAQIENELSIKIKDITEEVRQQYPWAYNQ